MAHGVVLSDANGRYLELKRRGLSAEAMLATLQDRAKPNAAWGWAGLFGAFAINLLVVLVLPAP